MSENKGKNLSLEFFMGLFFIGAVAILCYFTIFVNKDAFAFLGFGNEEHVNYKDIYFEKVGSLRKNDKVFLRGMQVGRVKKVEITDDYQQVEVKIRLKKQIPFYKNYNISVQTSSLFGGQILVLEIGTPDAGKVDVEKKLKGEPFTDLFQEVSEFVSTLKAGGLVTSIKSAAEEVNAGAKTFNEYMTIVKDSDGTLNKLINDPTLFEDLKSAAVEVKAGAKEVQVGAKELKAGAEEFTNYMQKMKNSKGTLSKLIDDSALYDELLKAAEEVRQGSSEIKLYVKDMKTSDGSLNKLINDPTLYNDAKSMVKNINKASENIAHIAEDMKNGKGTIGKFITDEALYNDIQQTVRELKAAVEDYREQAPVATFGSMLFGAL